MNSVPFENHRTRVAAERRERTRTRLLQSALLVFSEKGPEAAVIDDVLKLAGMARGSFYNYFRTNQELLEAVATEIGNELLRIVDPIVQERDDPIARIACGARLILHAARNYPLLGAFLSKLTWPSGASQLQGIQFLARDLEAGVAARQISCPPRVAVDLVMGAMFGAASSLAHAPLPDDYPEAMVHAILRGLGVSTQAAAQAITLPVPDIALEENSILKGPLIRRT